MLQNGPNTLAEGMSISLFKPTERTGSPLCHSEKHSKGRRFTTPIRTQDAKYLACFDLQIQFLDSFDPAKVLR